MKRRSASGGAWPVVPKNAPIMLGVAATVCILTFAAVVIFRMAGVDARSLMALGIVIAICALVVPPTIWTVVNYVWPVLYPNMRYSDGSVPWRLRRTR